MEYNVRNAKRDDLQRIEEIYAYARSFMKRTGNPDQWGDDHPPVDLLIQDITENCLYVIEDASGIHGVFYLFIGDDPTYATIYDGAWRSNGQYGTIHRIAGDGSGDILKTAVAFSGRQIDYLRIDTHADNQVMQNTLGKLGFQYCGIIYISDGTPRMAYDKI